MEATQKKIDAKANLAERARLANERIEERLRHPNGASFAQDEEGLNKAYNDLVESGKPIDRIVGHSLGGSVALQMQKDHFVPQSRTFGAPVVDLKPFHRFYNKAERYRHPLDPVSIFDRGATWGDFKPYSHTYTGFS